MRVPWPAARITAVTFMEYSYGRARSWINTLALKKKNAAAATQLKIAEVQSTQVTTHRDLYLSASEE
jgi:hypothetical protein